MENCKKADTLCSTPHELAENSKMNSPRYPRPEASIGEEFSLRADNAFIDVSGSLPRHHPINSRLSQHREVSFGTTTLREYERKLDSARDDTALGLTIGWRYIEHEPVPVESFRRGDKDFGKARMISDVDRANILLKTGYTKRELRAALKQQRERNPDIGGTIMLKPLRSMPTILAKRVSKGTKHFLVGSISNSHWSIIA